MSAGSVNDDCTEANLDQLAPNPADPNSYYQCTPDGWQLMPCPAGLEFDAASSRCEWPSAEDE